MASGCSPEIIGRTDIKDQNLIQSIASLVLIENLPFSTCTRTLATSAFDGEQEYLPESSKSAFCIIKCDVVTSPFSVITYLNKVK